MDHRTGPGRTSRLEMIVLAGLGAAALVVLGIVPLRTVLSLGVFLICPLIMLGMHRVHGHSGMHGGPGEGSDHRHSAEESFEDEP